MSGLLDCHTSHILHTLEFVGHHRGCEMPRIRRLDIELLGDNETER